MLLTSPFVTGCDPDTGIMGMQVNGGDFQIAGHFYFSWTSASEVGLIWSTAPDTSGTYVVDQPLGWTLVGDRWIAGHTADKWFVVDSVTAEEWFYEKGDTATDEEYREQLKSIGGDVQPQ